MCFTSPPYNGHTELNTHRIVDGKRVYKSHDLYLDNDADNKTPEEYLAFNALVFAAIGLAVESDGNIFYNLSYNANSRSEYIRIIADALDAGFCLHETIVWRKRGMPNPAINVLTRDYEFVFLLNRAETYRTNKRYAEPSSNVWEIANAGAQNELHHACFPVALPARALADTTAGGDIIFEPFSGSGTTLIACEQLGRKCRGIEISPAYVAVTLERWATMTGKTPELLP